MDCHEALLIRLRKVVQEFMNNEDYKSAAYWANKVISLSGEEKCDVYTQAKCYYQMKEYHRAAYCIKSRNLDKEDLGCRHLAAKCHFVTQEYKEAFEILEQPTQEVNASLMSETEKKWRSAIALLKGHIFEALDNRAAAVDCFHEALKWDVYCYEAFYSLIQHQMLTIQEEEELIASLKPVCPPLEKDFIMFLYQSQLKKYAKPSDLKIPEVFSNVLADNVDVLTSVAERHYYNCDYLQCFKITSQVLSRDLYHTQCLPIHLSCLMELKKTNILFELAHKLVELYPESPISWYAVGCYYLMIKKTDAARRFLNKATTLDNVFGPAWLLYGHSFAAESEHDQAMAAYFKASHLMKGCHLPLLYIGLEYGLTDNTKLAEKFFNQALVIAPQDPFVLHELGVIAYQNQDYLTAENHFTTALNLIKKKKDITSLPEKWEPLLNNLGHVYRKLKRYEDALQYHKEALVLLPQNPSSYSALGFVYSLMRKWRTAVEYFHKALGLKRDDPFSTAMLGNALDHLINEITPLEEELPDYESPAYMDTFLSKSVILEDSNCSKVVEEEIANERDSSSMDNNGSSVDVEMEMST